MPLDRRGDVGDDELPPFRVIGSWWRRYKMSLRLSTQSRYGLADFMLNKPLSNPGWLPRAGEGIPKAALINNIAGRSSKARQLRHKWKRIGERLGIASGIPVWQEAEPLLPVLGVKHKKCSEQVPLYDRENYAVELIGVYLSFDDAPPVSKATAVMCDIEKLYWSPPIDC